MKVVSRVLLMALSLLALLILVGTTLAQDEDVTAVSTAVLEEVADVQIVSIEPGGTVNVTPQSDFGQIALIGLVVVFVASLITSTIVQLRQGQSLGAALDYAASTNLQAAQSNREAMAAQERAYSTMARVAQTGIEGLRGALEFIAPFTPMQSDDALLEYIEDVQTPGAPGSPSSQTFRSSPASSSETPSHEL